MGEVYRADDLKLGQPVALKFLPVSLANDPTWLARFHNEVRVARAVTHPNVCRVHDIGEAEGLHFLAMELVDGEDLGSLLRRIGRLPVDKAVEIARELCAGLAAAHERGVLHRDLKPANVLIDGRGHVRLADFGLAELVGGPGAHELAGTPAYMAPEQLAGGQASAQSDLYALGLVLYETFTGRRLFEGHTLSELLAQHRESRPPSLSSAVRDVPPALEQAILRCLEEDPKGRPASVHVVLAAVPGGDPLQAALAAGETPSPAMVAAAGELGELRPAVAWAYLVAAIVGLLLMLPATAKMTLARRVPLPKPPEALVIRARELVAALGYREPPADSADRFWWDSPLVQAAINRPEGGTQDWDRLGAARPAPLYFYYRQSPRLMVPTNQEGLVYPEDPPLDVSGMLEVALEPDGGLRFFTAVPPQREEPRESWPEVDWSLPLREAGFEPKALRAVAPAWAAPVDTDRKVAWEGSYPNRPDQRVRVEAASYHGRPVWFTVLGPWSRPARLDEGRPGLAMRGAMPLFVAFVVFVQVGAAVLARRNLRSGRGDRRGALRVGGFVFTAWLVAALIRADHLPGVEEYALLTQLLARALYVGGLVWVLYLALEPSARRRWPRMLISWSRLLQGRWRDPMVGRDVLFGVVGATAFLLLVTLFGAVVPAFFGGNPVAPRVLPLSPLGGTRHLLFFMVRHSASAVVQALVTFLGLLVFRVVLRRQWAALAVLAVVFATYMYRNFGHESLLAAALASGAALLFVTAILPRGLLCLVVLTYVALALEVIPGTPDLSAWYAGRALLALGFLAALAVYGFVVSLGGKPAFGEGLLEE